MPHLPTGSYPLTDRATLLVVPSQMYVDATTERPPETSLIRQLIRQRFRVTVTLGNWSQVGLCWRAVVVTAMTARL